MTERVGVGELPTGTVTFLFTDLEGSTRLWEEHPDAMRAALARHDEILRAAVTARDGVVVKTTGDGLHAVFSVAPDAVAAAIDAQRRLVTEPWSLPEPLRVRMGLHTGVAEMRDGDYYGTAVNRAARVAAAAHGGQVVASAASADLVADDVGPEITLTDLGEHRLRDLGRPERIFQLSHPDLLPDFPPLRSLDAYPGNLPVQRTAFVGRADDLAGVSAALEDAPVVTLTGVGGVGKTRLALQVAAEAVSKWPDGAWFVDLSSVTDADFVAPTFSSSLSLPERRQGTLQESIVAALRDKNLLVVVDNCEHVIESVADLVDAIVGSCPGVRVLATSREALDVDGEDAYEVRPLDAPDAEDVVGGATIENDAVRLFAERARSARRGFYISEDNAPVVAEICRRLDGIPLALELAAARLKMMTPAEVLARLDERLPLLAGGRRSLLERHQTLRSAIDWSYALLEPAEQLLFVRLSVFAGGFTLEAAERVGTDDDRVRAPDVLSLLGGLVAKSMVVAADTDVGTRYRLLETLREYARERLAELDDPARVHDLHAKTVLAFVAEYMPRMKGADVEHTVACIVSELDNVREALVWTRDRDPDVFVALVRESALYLQIAANFRELRQWTREALDHADSLPADSRAEVLAYAASGANYANDFDDAFELYEQSLQCSRDAGLEPMAFALASLGIAALEDNRPEEAVAYCQAGVDAARASGDTYWELFAMSNLVLAVTLGGDHERGRVISDEAVSKARRLGNEWMIGTTLLSAGINRVLDQPELAVEMLEESAARLSTGSNLGQSSYFRAIAYLRLGRLADAARMLRAALPRMKETGSDFFTGTVIATAASMLVRESPRAAAELLGALERDRADAGIAGAPRDIETQQRSHVRLARLLGDAELAEALRRGSELTIPEAADLAEVELAKLEP